MAQRGLGFMIVLVLALGLATRACGSVPQASHVGDDECVTWYDVAEHGSAFRNAKDYGAAGDGVTDDTAALQRVLTEGRSTPFTLKTPLVVYLPPGTYVVHDTLAMYFYTHLVGNWRCPPTIRLANSSTTMSQAYVVTATNFNQGSHVSNFYHKLQNVIIDIGDGNPNAVGIHWAVAQGTSIRNVTVNVNNGHMGLFVESGGGGFIGDLVINGGQIGASVGGQQWSLRSITVNNAAQVGFQLSWDWVFTLVDLTINNSPVGLTFQGASAGSFVLIDSTFSNVGTAIVTDYPSALRGMVLQNFAYNQIQSLTQAMPAVSGSGHIDRWFQGSLYNASQLMAATTGSLPAPSGPLVKRALPVVADNAVVSAYDYGAKGDGQTDDTIALQTALNTGKIVFLPYGNYRITSTVTIPSGSGLVGEALSILSADGTGSAFADPSNPQPMLQTGDRVLLADLTLSLLNNALGCILLEWNADAASTMHDVHARVYFNASMLMHVTPGAGGYLENSWLWTADHNIDSNTNVTAVVQGGLLLEGAQDLTMYGTAVEHNAQYNYNITDSSHVVAVVTQTETPYWQGPPTSWALTIGNSKNISMYGTGYYSWFYGVQQDIVQVDAASQVDFFAHNVYGVTNMLSGVTTVPATYNSTFCSTMTVNLDA
ncbi:uncharacterized protein MONBRDRAFT_32819 [Monosiga brevicollis MX1]|uniref:Rhamnogalacturonase A/B/Epimerase-like pectate lyase domain-containing protein n=1 Tax=Monosiga brevicollis TaxID=81824 RepID=A9V1W5_MONBE|nr:uncharacterized protein MONBRDRAFT_32819 [Monosiga brevicollis MX1]EDQ88634.1 predicted protein [Monosiga brevicollis MX1]|eukprot:XP_001746738.1 hypothetical protein [Monosiga brevicollis MX1]